MMDGVADAGLVQPVTKNGLHWISFRPDFR
jgi:hypothetical protein